MQTGRPVSSGYLAQRLNYQVSPATIRNVMAELEREGYLSQPHTSAGRIPTDEGLKFYVNSIMDEALVNVSDSFGPCPEDLALDSGEMDTVLLQVSQILANTSDNLAFVISPQISRVNFDQVRFIKLKDNKIMLVLLSTFNLVQTEIFETQMLFTQAELDRAAQYLNLNFRGKNLAYVRDYLFRELPKLKIKYEDLVEKMISLLKNYLAPEREKSKIFIQGTARLLEKVEFFDLQKLKSLFQNFEEKAQLAKLLSDLISLERVKVVIGSELNIPEITDCSLVLSHYGNRSQVLGSLGIIGPKRLPYEKIIPLVDKIARNLSWTISTMEKGVEL